MTPRARVLLMLAIATLMMAVALTTMPQRARSQDEPRVVLMMLTELGWMRYVSPKGHVALPQSRGACEVDRVAVANLRQGHRLECRPAR